MLAKKKKVSNAQFCIGNAVELPFKDGTFDILVSNAAIERIEQPERVISEFVRVTNKRGKIVITSDCYSWRILQILSLYHSFMPYDRAIEPRYLLEMFKRNDLILLSLDAWGINHFKRGFRKFFIKPLIKLDNLTRLSISSDKTFRIDQKYKRKLRDILNRTPTKTTRPNLTTFLKFIKLYILDENVFYLEKTSKFR